MPSAENDAPDPRPCRGRNANVCVAEGCYGEACVVLASRVIPPRQGDHDVYRCDCRTDAHERPHTRVIPPG